MKTQTLKLNGIEYYLDVPITKSERLVEICPFIDVCPMSDYGSVEDCHTDYFNCVYFQRYLGRKLE